MDYRHDILRRKRKELGVSYERIANKSGLSLNATWEAINGKVDPSASTLKKLYTAMGLDPRCAFDFKLKVSDLSASGY